VKSCAGFSGKRRRLLKTTIRCWPRNCVGLSALDAAHACHFHAIAGSVELAPSGDNFRHASISTTSIYLHADEQRARQFAQAFTD
jgi:hypothetical protein